MGRWRARFAALLAIAFAALTSAVASPLRTAQNAAPAVPASVRKIFMSHCTECHSGASPSAGMSLEPARLPASILDKPSAAKPDFKIADSAVPERSYLLMKLRGAAGIAGSRMPLRANRLKDEDIRTLADWLAGLKPQAGDGEAKKKPEISAFQGVTLANLPTDTLIDRGHFLFRVSHRFFPAVDTGWDSFFGLDGPGAILLGFGYGLSDRLYRDAGADESIPGSGTWLFLESAGPGRKPSLLGAAMHAGASLTTSPLARPDGFFQREFPGPRRELSLTRRLSDRLLASGRPRLSSPIPTSATPAAAAPSPSGCGGRYMFLDGLSLIAEWVPVLAGYSSRGQRLGLRRREEDRRPRLPGLRPELGRVDVRDSIFPAGTCGTRTSCGSGSISSAPSREETMKKRFWRCFVCNDIHWGVKPPEICPTCRVKDAYVEISAREAKAILGGAAGGAPISTKEDFRAAIEAFAGDDRIQGQSRPRAGRACSSTASSTTSRTTASSTAPAACAARNSTRT